MCELAGISYKSPHKLRHGHAVYALSNAQSIADMKAISQNLMHSDLSITDKIYGVLTESDLKKRIERISLGVTAQEGKLDLDALMTTFDVVELEKMGKLMLALSKLN